MNAKKYGGSIAACRGPRQYANVTLMTKPAIPLRTNVHTIASGRMREASRTSSAMTWYQPSS